MYPWLISSHIDVAAAKTQGKLILLMFHRASQLVRTPKQPAIKENSDSTVFHAIKFHKCFWGFFRHFSTSCQSPWPVSCQRRTVFRGFATPMKGKQIHTDLFQSNVWLLSNRNKYFGINLSEFICLSYGKPLPLQQLTGRAWGESAVFKSKES